MKMNNNLPNRKQNRLKDYNYSNNGAYFLTVCTKDRVNLLWHVGASIARPQNELTLSENGIIVKEAIENINNHYPSVEIDNYVIMPNHIHLLMRV